MADSKAAEDVSQREALMALRMLGELAEDKHETSNKRKRLGDVQEPLEEEYLDSLKAQGLTERGIKRFRTADGFLSQEKRCRPSSEYIKYFKEQDQSFVQKSIDFRMPTVEAAARAEDLVMLWAYYNGKEELRKSEFRFTPEGYLANAQLKNAIQRIKTFNGLKDFIKTWCASPAAFPKKLPDIEVLFTSKETGARVFGIPNSGVTFVDSKQPQSLADLVKPELKHVANQKLIKQHNKSPKKQQQQQTPSSRNTDNTEDLETYESGIFALSAFIVKHGKAPTAEQLPWLRSQLLPRITAGLTHHEVQGLTEAVRYGELEYNSQHRGELHGEQLTVIQVQEQLKQELGGVCVPLLVVQEQQLQQQQTNQVRRDNDGNGNSKRARYSNSGVRQYRKQSEEEEEAAHEGSDASISDVEGDVGCDVDTNQQQPDATTKRMACTNQMLSRVPDDSYAPPLTIPLPSSSDAAVPVDPRFAPFLPSQDQTKTKPAPTDELSNNPGAFPRLISTQQGRLIYPLHSNMTGLSSEVACAIRNAEAGQQLSSHDVIAVLEAGIAGTLPISPQTPLNPKPGSVYIMDRNKTKIKQDGLVWAKELHSTLMVDGERRLKCYFTTTKAGDPMKRRCFWDLLKAGSAPDLAVVQYLPVERQTSPAPGPAPLHVSSTPLEDVWEGPSMPNQIPPKTLNSIDKGGELPPISGPTTTKSPVLSKPKKRVQGHGGRTTAGALQQASISDGSQGLPLPTKDRPQDPPTLVLNPPPSSLGQQAMLYHMSQQKMLAQAMSSSRSAAATASALQVVKPVPGFPYQEQPTYSDSHALMLGPPLTLPQSNVTLMNIDKPKGQTPPPPPPPQQMGIGIPQSVVDKLLSANKEDYLSMSDALMELYDTDFFSEAVFELAMKFARKELSLSECSTLFSRFEKYVSSGKVAMVDKYAAGLVNKA